MNLKDILAPINKYWVLLLFFIFAFSSCKKCMVCKNTCYICKSNVNINLVDTLCNTDYPDDMLFNDLIANIRSRNYTCNISKSSKEVELCDTKSSLNNFKQSYEVLRYQCLDK